MSLKNAILSELDKLIAEGQRLDGSYQIVDMGMAESSVPEVEFQSFATSARASIARICGKESEFYNALPQTVPQRIGLIGFGASVVPIITGSLTALRNAVDGGWLVSLEARLRANVYDDLLVQAEELLNAGYHVASMVFTGGVLEDHLRKLCQVNVLTWTGSGGISKYNDLLRDKVYPQPTWRRIQGNGDLRNEAAHGNVSALKVDDVADSHKYVGRFLADYPT
jgi:hypothetical protein